MSESAWINGPLNTRTSGTIDIPLFGARLWDASTWARTLIPFSVDIKKLRVKLSVAPGVGEARLFTVYKNGGATAAAVMIAGTDTTGQDLVDVAALDAGDYGYLHCTSTANPAASRLMFSLQMDGITPNETLLSGVVDQTPLSTSNTEYITLAGGMAGQNQNFMSTALVLPCSGTVKKLYVELATSPVAGGFLFPPPSRVFRVMKNNGITTLTCSIGGNNTTGNDVAHSFTVAAGDYICVKESPFKGNRANPWPRESYVSASVVLLTDTDDEFVVPIAQGASLPAADGLVEWGQVCIGQPDWQGIEGNAGCISPRMMFKRIQVLLRETTGGGGNPGWMFRLRRNSSNSGLGVYVGGGDSADYDDVGGATTHDDDIVYLSARCTGPPIPAQNYACVSLLGSLVIPSGAVLLGANF